MSKKKQKRCYTTALQGHPMLWIPIGYFPKKRTTRSNWKSVWANYPQAVFPAPPPIEEICSVSRCIAGGPDEGMGEDDPNVFGGYRRPAAAWQSVPSEERPGFDLHAYRIAPLRYRDGDAVELDVPELDVEPFPDSFERLGYDAVEFTDHALDAFGAGVPTSPFGCSPLSCNGQTADAKVNRYCLVETEAEGLELARLFSISKPEPGPYCVVEVWRERLQ